MDCNNSKKFIASAPYKKRPEENKIESNNICTTNDPLILEKIFPLNKSNSKFVAVGLKPSKNYQYWEPVVVFKKKSLEYGPEFSSAEWFTLINYLQSEEPEKYCDFVEYTHLNTIPVIRIFKEAIDVLVTKETINNLLKISEIVSMILKKYYYFDSMYQGVLNEALQIRGAVDENISTYVLKELCKKLDFVSKLGMEEVNLFYPFKIDSDIEKLMY